MMVVAMTMTMAMTTMVTVTTVTMNHSPYHPIIILMATIAMTTLI